MKNYFGLIINIVLINITFSQTPCILGSVYVSEAANQGDPDDYTICQEDASDMNSDGVTDILDVVLLINIILGP